MFGNYNVVPLYCNSHLLMTKMLIMQKSVSHLSLRYNYYQVPFNFMYVVVYTFTQIYS